jgi:hypothetical protein
LHPASAANAQKTEFRTLRGERLAEERAERQRREDRAREEKKKEEALHKAAETRL